MANRKQKTQESPKERRAYLARLAVLWVLYIGVLAVLFDVSPVGGNNIQYYVKVIQCGRVPQVSMYPTSGIKWYAEARHTFRIGELGGDTYFCTPLEAEQAGYSAEPSRFVQPHMEQ